jgi:hypothetical protein
MAADSDWLIWNHGGAGDDVETAHPSYVVSVLTPTSRYMEPFVSHLAAEAGPAQVLRIAHGNGRFGRQVASGAEAYSHQLGFSNVVAGPASAVLSDDLPEHWILVSAGTFEDDIEVLMQARGLPHPPRITCAVAAGVREFSLAFEHYDGTFGIAQWFPGSGQPAFLGPGEHEFLRGYHATADAAPDYPAVQASAAASLAVHCARQVSSTERNLLWSASTALDTSTMFGKFKIDQTTGMQVSHQTVLTRWTDGQLVAVSMSQPSPGPDES